MRRQVPLRILALVPEDSLFALRSALDTDHVVAWLPDGPSLIRAASESGAEAVVVDPSVVADAEWDELHASLTAMRAPLLLYARLTQPSVRRIVAASAAGPLEVILRSFEDDPLSLRGCVLRMNQPAPPARIMAHVANRLAGLPDPLQRAMVPLFCSGSVPRWAREIAAAAACPRRSVDRWMGRVGLAGTAAVLDVARLSRVWVPIVDEHRDPAEVAVRVGFRRPRMLGSHTRRIIRASPSHLGSRLKVDDFVARLVRYVVRA